MRCFFMKNGHLAGVEALAGMSDEDHQKSHELFAARKGEFVGFEVWELARMLIQHPAPESIGSPDRSESDGRNSGISSSHPVSPSPADARRSA
jgi:hypothetical protein